MLTIVAYLSILRARLRVPARLRVNAPALISCRFYLRLRVRASLQVNWERDLRIATDLVRVEDPGSPLFGEMDVVANRDVAPGELGPYAGVLLRDDEVCTPPHPLLSFLKYPHRNIPKVPSEIPPAEPLAAFPRFVSNLACW